MGLAWPRSQSVGPQRGAARVMAPGVESQRSPEGEAQALLSSQISPSERSAWMPVANVPSHDTGCPEPPPRHTLRNLQRSVFPAAGMW
jgi:hypothetical protein